MADGIHIPKEVAEREALPEDLDANLVGPYRFPNPRRRRTAAAVYLLSAALMAGFTPGEPRLWLGVALLAGLGLYHLAAAWPLRLEQEEALSRAAALVDYPVGHVSAAVTFHGWRARPRWHVIVYDAHDPPARRSLVELDAVSGEPTAEVYTEEIPPPAAG
jgi:hypothetical protein